MKKIIAVICLLLLSGWVWNTHENIAEQVVSSLEVSDKINFTELKIGARVPDEVFRDFRNHHYPISYDKAEEWISFSKEQFLNGNYNNASYGFGVASHYMLDSFSAPHYVSYEPSALHSQFENQIKNYNIKTICLKEEYDLFFDLDVREKSKTDWGVWLITKDKKIPEKEIEKSSKLLYKVALDVFNSSCKNQEKKSNFFYYNPFHMLFNIIIGLF